MKLSQKGLSVTKHYAGFKANPYFCPANKPTIGYGTLIYPCGQKVKLTDHAITEAEATEYLIHDVEQFERDVNKLLQVTVTQSQFDALVCFAYNVGSDIDIDKIAEGLGDSTLLKLVNANIMKTDFGWKKRITVEFMKWINGGGKKLKGLIARRTTEAYLFTDDLVKFFN